jgi:hypothetical protein
VERQVQATKTIETWKQRLQYLIGRQLEPYHDLIGYGFSIDF